MFSTSIRQYVGTLRSHVLIYSYTEFWITWLAYPLSYNFTSSIILTSSYNSCTSRLSNWHTYITRSITLSPPSLSLSLKILPISKLFIRGIVFSYLIYCHPSLMPFFIASIYYTTLITFILFISKIMPSYFYCVKKGLVCIIIAALFGH